MLSVFLRKTLTFSFLVTLGLSLFQCESLSNILPEEFQEGELSLLPIDEKACDYITRPLIRRDTVYVDDPDTVIIDTIIIDTLGYEVRALFDSLGAAFDSLISDSVIATDAEKHSTFDALMDTLAPLVRDTSLSIRYPATEVKSFMSYTHVQSATGVSGVVVYLNDYIHVDILDRDGFIQDVNSAAIVSETVAGCTDFINNPGPTEIGIDRHIKIRSVLQLEQGEYLVRFTLMEGAAGGPFRAAVIYNE
ncbi:MAG: hypothetical protein JSW54_06020 [Fidelibacterota bacterium]|nr:MAG: hypothetical protein JSW54_06020 [Candidatus Neomarinimicrobiota bacterium]